MGVRERCQDFVCILIGKRVFLSVAGRVNKCSLGGQKEKAG